MELNPKETGRFNGVIRSLKKKDIPTLQTILEYWLRDFNVVAHDEVEEDISTMRNSLDEASSKRMFVAEKDGKAIGMMGLVIPPKDVLLQFAKTDSPSELIMAYVHPDYRGGMGVGTALINTAQDLAKSKGRKEILLESGPRHAQTGYPFYDKQPGFKRAGQINDFYGKGVHTVVWQKTF